MRLIALFGVCICHACDPLSAFGAPAEKQWIEYYGSFVRFCVPLFVMLTGALLLPDVHDFGEVFHKRIRRVLVPFLVWTAIYAALPPLLHLCGLSEETIQRTIFPWAAPMHTTWSAVPRTFLLSLIQFNQYAVQLWYIYLLVGLYLFMPILSAWLRIATPRAKWILLALCAGSMATFYWPLILHACCRVSLLADFFGDYLVRFGVEGTLAQTTAFSHLPILGVCDWNSYGLFHTFSGFTGYLLLGHLLRHLRLSRLRALLIGLPLTLGGFWVILLGTRTIWHAPGVTTLMLEYFWWYCSLPVAALSAGIWILVQHFLTRAPAPLERFLRHFTRIGFSVFCVHYVFVTGAYYFIGRLCPGLTSALLVPLAATAGLSISILLMSALYRLPKARFWFG